MIPIFNEKDSSTRDKIVAILATYPGISTKKINAILKKQYALNVTYQAVHKTLKQMVEQGILEYKNKTYSLSIYWLEKIKKLVERIEKKGLENQSTNPENALGKIKELSEDLGMVNFEFKTIAELDEFLTLCEEFYIDNYAKQGEEIAFARKHLRQPIIYQNYNKSLFDKYKKKRLSGYIVCEGDTTLDNWSTEFYNDRNTTVRNNASYNFPEDEIVVLGRIVIKVYFPQELREKIENFFLKVNTLTDFFPEKFNQELNEGSYKILVNVQKNEYFANKIKNELKSFYLRNEIYDEISSLKKQKESKKMYHLNVENLYMTKKQVSYYENFVVPYLSETETNIIEEKMGNQLPYAVFKKNEIHFYNLGCELGHKAQKVLIDYYRQYKVNLHQISITKSMMKTARDFLTRFMSKDVNYSFHSSSLRDFDKLELFKNRKEPGVFLLLDYNYGNYDPKEILKPFKKIMKKDDLLVFSLQFSPEYLTKGYVSKLMNYYSHRYEGFRFDCGILYEMGFNVQDIEMIHEFNEKERRIESYSIIKSIPERLVNEVKEIGLKEGDIIMNYFSRKPALSKVKEEISEYFNFNYVIDEDNNVGVVFCRIKNNR